MWRGDSNTFDFKTARSSMTRGRAASGEFTYSRDLPFYKGSISHLSLANARSLERHTPSHPSYSRTPKQLVIAPAPASATVLPLPAHGGIRTYRKTRGSLS